MRLGVAAVPTVGFVVWLVRLEGRVNGHDEAMRNFKEDLHYIRARIDEAIRK